MKKFYSLSAIALIFMMAFSLQSCDEDVWIADSLEGTWEGNMFISYEYDNRVYDATYTEIGFELDPFRFRRGTGYWIDHYDNYGWGRNYVANHIRWEVVDRTIHIYFMEEGNDLYIEDYSISENYFTGYIYDGDTRVKFKLRHTSSPHWDDYDYGYNYYYAKPNVTEGAAAEQAPVVRRFVRPSAAEEQAEK